MPKSKHIYLVSLVIFVKKIFFLSIYTVCTVQYSIYSMHSKYIYSMHMYVCIYISCQQKCVLFFLEKRRVQITAKGYIIIFHSVPTGFLGL